MALKRLGIEVEHVGISEVDKYALISHRAIHGEVLNLGGVGSFDTFPPNIDICTWSFPCQDISLAGTQSGMVDGSRSNYGYTFLDTIKNMSYDDRPQVLIMENVKALVSSKFKHDYEEIHLRLESMGYQSYGKVLIATDYGIPQTRERIFIVSIKGEYTYNFPKPYDKDLFVKLKYFLEKNVDEKYFLSQKQLEKMALWNSYQNPLEEMKDEEDEFIQTITAKSNTSMNASMLLIKEKTKRGYAIAEEGDGVYIDRPHQKRGVVQKDKIQTLKTSNNDVGVVVKDERIKEHQMFDYVSSKQFTRDLGNEIAPTIKTRNHVAIAVKNGFELLDEDRKLKDRLYKQKIERKERNLKIAKDPTLRIRKLTPLESWRLMGIKDEDFYKAQSAGISDSQLYKQAGNAIVVDVLMAIFKEMF